MTAIRINAQMLQEHGTKALAQPHARAWDNSLELEHLRYRPVQQRAQFCAPSMPPIIPKRF